MRCCSGIECAECVMNLDQYRAVTKTELDIADHSDTAGDAGEMTSRARHKHDSNPMNHGTFEFTKEVRYSRPRMPNISLEFTEVT